MDTLSITVPMLLTVDLNDLESVERSATILNSLLKIKASVKKAPAKKAATTSAEEEVPAVEKTAAVKKAEAEAEAETAKIKGALSGGHDITSIRTLVNAHKLVHRAEIKAKLTELGSANVTNLDPENFPAMHEFLSALK